MKLTIIQKKGVKQEITKKTRISKETWQTIDTEIKILLADVIEFSKIVALEDKRTTLFSEDIKRGTQRYLESFSPNYLPQLQSVVNNWFNQKLTEEKNYGNKRIYSNETKE